MFSSNRHGYGTTLVTCRGDTSGVTGVDLNTRQLVQNAHLRELDDDLSIRVPTVEGRIIGRELGEINTIFPMFAQVGSDLCQKSRF
jgi:hypothetical protein